MSPLKMLFHKVSALFSMKFVKRQKLKDNLFIILFVVVFTVSLLSLIALQVVLHLYDNQLYRESAKVLNLTSTIIENELQKIENASFLIMADPNVQKHLVTVKNSPGNYEKYQSSDVIQDILSSYAWSEEYIHSIMLIDSKRNQLRAGAGFTLPDLKWQEIRGKTAGQSGKHVWIQPDRSDRFLTSARIIRQIPGLSLEDLGLVIIRVDLNKLIKEFSHENPSLNINLQIFADGLNILAAGPKIFPDEYRKSLPVRGYEIKPINRQQYFIAYTKTAYTGWTYANVIPYRIIYQEITSLRYLMILFFAVAFGFALWAGFKFAKSITRPIENLAARMNQVENGDFSVPLEPSVNSNIEEICNLARDFEIMVRRIDALIRENYAKQLLIKDTRYKVLQAQINPHFLYNTLDSVNWLAQAGEKDKISIMVQALGDLLRNSISKEDVITLGEELQILKYYITIQKIRYEERLDFQMEISEDFLQYVIPKLTLQPIVENAINYGLEKMIGVCKIQVSIQKNQDGLIIAVEDNGPGIEPDLLEKQQKGKMKTKSTGIGLQNIEERIRMFFGREYKIEITSEKGKGTRVSMIIPALSSGEGF